ncbi:hypothetical protein B0J17DRAFT_670654 [Rhizoctonia solani]|nr:hypothetical protein B0J17DRAFT_670654 [Rhizoctonia solani]
MLIFMKLKALARAFKNSITGLFSARGPNIQLASTGSHPLDPLNPDAPSNSNIPAMSDPSNPSGAHTSNL